MPNNAVHWLASVSEHCRKLIEIAGLAIRDHALYEQEANKGQLQAALKAHADALNALLPDDFPQSRIGDLLRHIRFCDPHDWYDIVLFDAPDILAKAEKHAQEIEPSPGEIEDYIHARFRPRYEMTMREPEPDYHALLLTCCVELATLFKRKSGAADDSDSEIGRVFKKDDPVLRVPQQFESETDKNLQRGAMLLMQGWRAFLRNPHAHEVRPTDDEYVVHSLMLMSFLARIIDAATVVEADGAN